MKLNLPKEWFLKHLADELESCEAGDPAVVAAVLKQQKLEFILKTLPPRLKSHLLPRLSKEPDLVDKVYRFCLRLK